jgi:hypothetical protein
MTTSRRYTILAILTAAFFFALSLSREVYDATSPEWLSWHVLLRKFYSVIAFALVGFTARRALEENGHRKNVAVRCVVGVAVYSAAIEVAQFFHGSHEGLGWNVFDTICGAAGGAIATADLIRASVRFRRAIPRLPDATRENP